MEQNHILFAAAFLGATAIVLGAFAAHKLKQWFSPDLLQSFETGVKYQMYHALLLMVLGFELPLSETVFKWAIWLLIGGTVLFSGSIYALCFSSAAGKKLQFLGPVTPLGGLGMLVGWVLLGIGFLTSL